MSTTDSSELTLQQLKTADSLPDEEQVLDALQLRLFDEVFRRARIVAHRITQRIHRVMDETPTAGSGQADWANTRSKA
jgi:hypothetical protein